MNLQIPKKAAVINSFAGYGRCSLTEALPILSAMRVQACPVPTAVFSNHTGFAQDQQLVEVSHKRIENNIEKQSANRSDQDPFENVFLIMGFIDLSYSVSQETSYQADTQLQNKSLRRIDHIHRIE